MLNNLTSQDDRPGKVRRDLTADTGRTWCAFFGYRRRTCAVEIVVVLLPGYNDDSVNSREVSECLVNGVGKGIKGMNIYLRIGEIRCDGFLKRLAGQFLAYLNRFNSRQLSF